MALFLSIEGLESAKMKVGGNEIIDGARESGRRGKAVSLEP